MLNIRKYNKTNRHYSAFGIPCLLVSVWQGLCFFEWL